MAADRDRTAPIGRRAVRLREALRGARGLWLFALAVLLAALLLALPGVGRPAPEGETALERRLAELLGQIDGVGKVHVMISGDDAPEGVVVICDRLESVRALLELQSAVQALLDVDADRIRIIGRNGFGGGGP